MELIKQMETTQLNESIQYKQAKPTIHPKYQTKQFKNFIKQQKRKPRTRRTYIHSQIK